MPVVRWLSFTVNLAEKHLDACIKKRGKPKLVIFHVYEDFYGGFCEKGGDELQKSAAGRSKPFGERRAAAFGFRHSALGFGRLGTRNSEPETPSALSL
jgi:hypothetical protein